MQAKDYKVVRAETQPYQACAYYVRIQAMAKKHHISPEEEFDEHDGPDTKYIVIMDDVLPIATCRLYPVDDSTMMLGRIVVLPEYREQGLGSLTVTEAEIWAKEMGFKKTTIESRVNKVGFYKTLGYEKISDEVIEGWTFDCVAMEKKL